MTKINLSDFSIIYIVNNKLTGYHLDSSNNLSYFKDGLLHKEDGPALFTREGVKFYIKGRLHNPNGPAVLHWTGLKFYFLHGQEYKSLEEVNRYEKLLTFG